MEVEKQMYDPTSSLETFKYGHQLKKGDTVCIDEIADTWVTVKDFTRPEAPYNSHQYIMITTDNKHIPFLTCNHFFIKDRKSKGN